MNLLEKVITFALAAHTGHTDKYGRPYILHPLHLMSQMETDEERMTAVLHDVVEDTERTLADIEALGVSESVVAAVALLTHDKEQTPYLEYVRALKPNPLARKVKLADLRHNMDIRRMNAVTEKDAERLERYRHAWQILTADTPSS
jgi:(p)ppGpp synthase/HD superfamily hydrolase